jgi:hypothetical protein
MKVEDHPLSAVRDCLLKYSQLPYISEGRLLHPQPEYAPCYSDKDPLNMVLIPIYSQLPSISGGRLLHPQREDAPCRYALSKSVKIKLYKTMLLPVLYEGASKSFRTECNEINDKNKQSLRSNIKSYGGKTH